ncbi:MAG: hypothetical protein ABSA32_05890 [Candidatus Acidiferrales bacterium]|jgi:hypothetical protein
MWSFRKAKKAPWENEGVLLTEEEARECQRFIRSLTVTDAGSITVRSDFADTANRLLTAVCLIGRANRFLISAGFVPVELGVGRGDPSLTNYDDYVAGAVETFAKACAIYPLSISFYDFACILRAVGYKEEAKATFAEFLRRHATIPIKAHEKLLFEGRDVARAVRDATNELSTKPGETGDEEIPF